MHGMQKNTIAIFNRILEILYTKQYISYESYMDITAGFERYITDEEKKKELEKEGLEKKPVKKVIVKKQPVKEKKKYTAEQLRERNIGVMLYLGVALLLIGGLVVATSNWDSMPGWMKAVSIFFVSILFFGVGLLSKKIIKIDHTAFAFFLLGSLFLPIGFVSVSFFQLAGDYLSMHGEGRFLLGVIAGLVLFPIYTALAVYLKSGLYKILTIGTITGTLAFLFAFLPLAQDGFFFFMIIYQFILIYVLLKCQHLKWIQYYQKELTPIVQLQLILTALFMTFLFDSSMINGFYYLVISSLFMMTVALTKRKHDHFFITIAIAFGLYRIFTNPILQDLLPVAFACFSILLLFFVFILKEKLEWGKVWEFTSFVIALATFFVTIVFYGELFLEGSMYLVFAYLLLAVEFLLLTKKLTYSFIRYLPVLFLNLALWNIAVLFSLINDVDSLFLVIYGINIVLLFLLGIFNKWHYLQDIRKESTIYNVSWMVLIAFLSTAIFIGKWYIPVMIGGIALSLYLGRRLIRNKTHNQLLSYLIPITVFGVYFTTAETFSFIQEQGLSLSIAIGSIFTVITGSLYERLDKNMGRIGYYIGQILYGFGLLLILEYFTLNKWVTTGMYLVAILVFYDLYRKIKNNLIAWLIGIVSLISYLTLVGSIWNSDTFLFETLMKYGWIGLFIIALGLKHTSFKLPFLTISHVYIIGSMVIDRLFIGSDSFLPFIYLFIVYSISIYLVANKYVKMAFRYGSYLSSYLFLATIISFDFAGGNSYQLAFMVLSIVLFGLYFLTQNKVGLLYFFLPFSVLGIISWLFAYPFSTVSYFVILLYIMIVLLVIHLEKLHLFSIGGVVFLLINNEILMYAKEFIPFDRYVFTCVWGVLFLFISTTVYSSILKWKEDGEKWIDFYLIGSILSTISLFGVETTFNWDIIIPGLFLSFLAYLQIKRVKKEIEWIPKLVSIYLLLVPYYSFLMIITIKEYIVTELVVLPWIIMVIATKKIISKLMALHYIEWGVIVIVALILAIDGYISHTIYDAIILGGLAILSILSGFYFRYKSYFFVGIGVLVLNVLLQTRPYWGNFPWWVYLLIAGSILIAIASIYEMQKQGKQPLAITKLLDWKNRLLLFLKTWK
ncbi:hypothetical protein [Bacillus sp. T2.9-1]|uniref:hypothetical protein n=2 Tax=Bacillaceae TaxID=186817 RepID=UPI00253F660A|nr:hypothetical protein [Bacillus sp. T2.9-1]